MSAISERRFQLNSGLSLAARVHHAGAGPRVLAVHGWLDNAASFDALAAELPELEMVALDLAGHGRSDHRPLGAWYHYVDYLGELVEVLDQLDWQRSLWLGHSLGGALLALLAAAHPERVERLLMIEAAGPLGGLPERAVAQLRRGIDERLRFGQGRTLRLFPDPGSAVAARMKANGLSEPAARTLVERGLRQVDGGWQWSSDPRLTLASPVRVGEPEVRALLGAIACPILLMLADPPLPFMPEAEREQRLACLSGARRVQFAGHHHLHMETPAPLAGCIRDFLAGTV